MDIQDRRDVSQFNSYHIHLCESDEASEVMKFINDHWKTDHILSWNKELFDWMYYNNRSDNYNFALARLDDTDEIIGIQGFIPTSIYDYNLTEDSVTWFTILKARDDVEPSGFGLQLINYVADYDSPSATGAIGINAEVAQIYRRFGYSVDTLNHYFMLNKSITDFSLVGNFNAKYEFNTGTSLKTNLLRVTGGTDELNHNLNKNMFSNYVPVRSVRYIQNRYIEHPFFDYLIYAIERGGEYDGILIFRPTSHNDSRALRWVEYLGKSDRLYGIGPQLQSILQSGNYEYVDIYNSGISVDTFEAAGMRYRGADSDIVIPDHYSPFEQKNISIRYAYKVPDGVKPMIFNGHGDMDRPNGLDKE
jgi:hypothetical protein